MPKPTLLALLAIITILSTMPVASKTTKHTINLQSLSTVPSTIFLTKFDIGVGEGKINIKYKIMRSANAQHVSASGAIQVGNAVQFGLLRDEDYLRFRKLDTCGQKEGLYQQKAGMVFAQSSWGSANFSISQKTHQHIWYIYLYNCPPAQSPLAGTVSIDITMTNNGSNFGQDENFLPGYAFLMVIWIILVIRLFIPVINSLKQVNANWQQVFIYSGFLLLGLAYFYRLLNLIIIYQFNQDVWVLHMLYTLFKYVVQGVMITILVSIAWGWSLTHLSHQPYYIIIGTVTTIINILAIILDSSSKQLQQAHHQYDRMLGIVLLAIRIAIFVIFVIGIMRCMAESVGKRRHFVKKFGMLGGLYVIGWPVGVLFCEIFLENYLHNQVVTLVEEGAHIIANAYMCHLFAFPDSDFKKVSLKQQEQALPIYKVKTKSSF